MKARPQPTCALRRSKNLPKAIRHSNLAGNTRIRESEILMKSAVQKVVDSGKQAGTPKSVVSKHKICCGVASHRVDCGRGQLEVVSSAHPYGCAGCSNLFWQPGIKAKTGLPVWLIPQWFIR